MGVVICVVIAFWFLANAGYIPVALAVVCTVFGSLSLLVRIIKVIVNVVKEQNRKKVVNTPYMFNRR